MNKSSNGQEQDICLLRGGITLTPLEMHCAWDIIKHQENVKRMGKYFYIGMEAPAAVPTSWWEVDCHLLGLLTERKCRLLPQESKDFLEHFILGERYKQYRRSLKRQTVS